MPSGPEPAAGGLFDVALVGVGGAGLTVLHALARVAPSTGRRWRVALVDDVDRLRDRPDDRTWCFWDTGDNPVDPALAASWGRVVVQRDDDTRQVVDLRPYRYAMLRSSDYYALVDAAVRAAADALDVVRFPSATAVSDGDSAAAVRTPGGDVRALHVLDSRPAPPRRAPTTTLLQHFHGAVVRTAAPVFDPDAPVLMDFRTPQPARGLSFGYCLPLDAERALLEYTEFSPAVLQDSQYRDRLDDYVRLVVRDHGYEVESLEHGVIPMNDGSYERRSGLRVMRIGTAGGATRPSTGYTFRTMQRQAEGIVAALVAGRPPVPPRPYPRRHALMDAALLRALDAGLVDGPDFFTRLFRRNPAHRVLAFLDGTSRPSSEAALMSTAPRLAMATAAAQVAVRRARLARRR